MDTKLVVRREARGNFEMHPSEPAVIVKYRVTAVILRSDGSEIARKSKDATKIITFVNLADATDVRRVAKDAIQKCQYLDQERIQDLEQILAAIRNRQKQLPLARPGSSLRPFTATPARRSTAEAKMADLQQYRCLLYNSLDERILGTEMILQLCQKPVNLSQVLRSEPLISALVRLLFEDESRNLDLKINVTRIFAALAQLSSAAQCFVRHRIGATLLQEMQTEMQRSAKLKDELSLRKSNSDTGTAETDQFRIRFIQLIRKQDLFMSASVQILTALGQDTSVQIKMVKRDVILILSRCCERSSPELQLGALRFLLSLSLYVENMDNFRQSGTVEIAVRVLDQQRSSEISNMVMRLLHNLSLCPSLKRIMFKKHLPRRLVIFLEKPETMECAAQVLYSISNDKKYAQDFRTPELINVLASLLMRHSTHDSSEFLLAALLNILSNPEAVSSLTALVSLSELCEISIDTGHSSLLKVVTACFSSAKNSTGLKENIFRLMEKFQDSRPSPFQLTCCLSLASAIESGLITVEELSTFYKLDTKVMEKCRQYNKPAELLALIVLIGALASSEFGARLLTDISLTDWLCNKLGDSTYDDEELDLQMGYALLKFTQFEPARLRIMEYPDVTKILSQRTLESSVVTKALFEELLLRLSLASEDIHEAWKMERFQQYNGQWLQALENRRDDMGDNNLYLDDFNDGDEMDLVTRYGLDDLSDDDMDNQEDVEDIIERYSARAQSRLGFRS